MSVVWYEQAQFTSFQLCKVQPKIIAQDKMAYQKSNIPISARKYMLWELVRSASSSRF